MISSGVWWSITTARSKNLSTKHKTPFELVYYEAYRSRSDAKYRERNLKDFAQAYKALKGRIKNSLLLKQEISG